MNAPRLRRAAAVLAGGLAVALTCSACKKEQAKPPAAPPAVMQVADTGFNTPESVLYDSAADVYLVDNINGNPLAKDDNGFISRVTPDGRIAALKWIAGGANGVALSAPKGSGIVADTLFVADIDNVRLFNRVSGAPIASVPIPGATFLNDICIGPDGTVYVTDTGLRPFGPSMEPSGTDALWKLGPGHRPVAVARGKDLGGPNGIIADTTGVTMVTYLSGQVFHFDKAGRRTELPKPPNRSLDGLIELADGTLLLSSWDARAVYRLPKGAQQYTVAVDSVTSPADIGWDPTRRRLLIPLFTLNRVVFREIH